MVQRRNQTYTMNKSSAVNDGTVVENVTLSKTNSLHKKMGPANITNLNDSNTNTNEETSFTTASEKPGGEIISEHLQKYSLMSTVKSLLNITNKTITSPNINTSLDLDKKLSRSSSNAIEYNV